VNLQNNTGSDPVYAYVTGQALDHGNALMLLEADGQTPYYPVSPAATGSPLQFLLNPGPALVGPSVTNPSDPHIGLQWDLCELTYNDAQLFANISFVDFVCVPVALTLTGSAGTQSVPGLPGGGLDTVCAGLAAQAVADGNGWNERVVSSNGTNLRALSPTNAMVLSPGLLAGSFAAPVAADIFSCNSGPFNPAGMSTEMLAILPRLAAAFNRSTLLTDSDQPDGENPADYYTNAITNHYARIVHATMIDGRGYAFPNDVAPAGGADQSGAVSDPAPALLTVTLGPIH
jgi:hypothetical protein